MRIITTEDIEELAQMEEELGILRLKMHRAWSKKDPVIFKINRAIKEMMIAIEKKNLKLIEPRNE